MPTKRRFIIFLIVLTLMLLIKRAVGQEQAVGWDPVYTYGGGLTVESQAFGTLLLGVIGGFLTGLSRVAKRTAAARDGRYFTGDRIQLRLQ